MLRKIQHSFELLLEYESTAAFCISLFALVARKPRSCYVLCLSCINLHFLYSFSLPRHLYFIDFALYFFFVFNHSICVFHYKQLEISTQNTFILLQDM